MFYAPCSLLNPFKNTLLTYSSEISTVEANWYVLQHSWRNFYLKLTLNRDLHTLGRWDVGANVFANVAKYTGDRIRKWSTTPDLAHRYFNSSYPGIFNTHGKWAPQPVPDCVCILDDTSTPHPLLIFIVS
jgi:acid phosphatase